MSQIYIDLGTKIIKMIKMTNFFSSLFIHPDTKIYKYIIIKTKNYSLLTNPRTKIYNKDTITKTNSLFPSATETGALTVISVAAWFIMPSTTAWGRGPPTSSITGATQNRIGKS